MHAHSLTRGVGARITRLYLKWLPGSAQPAFLQKHDHGDLGNAMMSLVNLDGSRLQRGKKTKEVVLMNYAVTGRKSLQILLYCCIGFVFLFDLVAGILV